MPGNSLEEARFDHVSDTGELRLCFRCRKFAVKIDEALERAILEAKQIRSEVQEEQKTRIPTHPADFAIQSLIRAGADPARVAERYSLSEALVRRFSASVETEKQYAIEQFLAVPAPKESRVRTLSELIERTFAAARVRLEDVTWKATRLGLELGKSALSSSPPVTMSARNVVEHARQCRKLPEFRSTKTHWRTGHVERRHAEKHADENFLVSLNLPGNSARSRVSSKRCPHGTRPSRPCLRPVPRQRLPFRSHQSAACLMNPTRLTRRTRQPSHPTCLCRADRRTLLQEPIQPAQQTPTHAIPFHPRRSLLRTWRTRTRHLTRIARTPPNRSGVPDVPPCQAGTKSCLATEVRPRRSSRECRIRAW